MYFGSVKFFKHLIYTVVFGWIAIATFLAVFFGIRLFIETHKEQPAEPAAELINIPDGTDIEQLFLIMTAKGYSNEEMLDMIRETDEETLREFVKSYIADNPDIAGNVDDPPAEFKDDNGTIYLTFDDGPSENTWDILAILKRYDIKATFFFCGGTDERSQEIMKAVADAGHTVGVHSISHDYEKVYESVESYLADFNDTYNCIYEATGVKPRFFRFPGGSINNYNRFVYMQIIAEMTRRGFVYFDWNVSGEDAARGATWTSIYNNILEGIRSNNSDRAIVLLHDAADKKNTVYVLEDIIDKLISDGYSFGQIDETVKPITFSYAD